MLIEAQEVIAILESEAGDTVPSMDDRETRALRKTLARMKLSLAKLGCLDWIVRFVLKPPLRESGNGTCMTCLICSWQISCIILYLGFNVWVFHGYVRVG